MKKTILYIVLQKYMDLDRLKRLAYHEIAHAGHYRQVGGREYWDQLVQAEVLAGGHGNENSTDAGRIALCESWAEHIALDFVKRRYPGVHNAPLLSNWANYHERIKNESNHHIPIGLYHDLTDNIDDVVDGCDRPRLNAAGTALIWGPCNAIDDQVSGITNQLMFQQLQSSIISPQMFVNQIMNKVIPGTSNTATQVENLFNSY